MDSPAPPKQLQMGDSNCCTTQDVMSENLCRSLWEANIYPSDSVRASSFTRDDTGNKQNKSGP